MHGGAVSKTVVCAVSKRNKLEIEMGDWAADWVKADFGHGTGSVQLKWVGFLGLI